MRNVILLTIFLLFPMTSFHGQTENSAPVIWERYRFGDEKLSVLLPKMPVRLPTFARCGELQTVTYFAYAEGAVYELKISSKPSKYAIPKECPKNPYFGPETLENRLSAFRSEAEIINETVSDKVPQWRKLTGKNYTRWFVSDIEKNNRWIEMAVIHYADQKPDLGRFLDSLEFPSEAGKEVGEGTITLGDPGIATERTSIATPTEEKDKPAGGVIGPGNGSGRSTSAAITLPLVAVARPKASYTQEARKAGVTGMVRLKVTFLSNGAVGAVVPVAALSHGLTEQAIAAARRTVFLPKKVNGIPVSIVQTIEYSFSIY